MSSKNCNFRELLGPFESNKDNHNWCYDLFGDDHNWCNDDFNNFGLSLSSSHCYPLVFDPTICTEL